MVLDSFMFYKISIVDGTGIPRIVHKLITLTASGVMAENEFQVQERPTPSLHVNRYLSAIDCACGWLLFFLPTLVAQS